MKNFKELRIWQKGIDIAVLSFKMVELFPKEERFGLSLQITRAGVSIPSNIAEGSSRTSEKDYNRFLEIALGSCFELETQVLIAEKVNFGNKDIRNDILQALTEEQKMLTAFKNKLEK